MFRAAQGPEGIVWTNEERAADLPPFVRTSDPSPAHSASPPLQRSPHLHNQVIDTVPDRFPASSLSRHGSLSEPP